MQRIDCTTTTIALRLPACATTITAATLGGIAITATPVVGPPAGVTLTVPDTIPQGVQVLDLTTDCGCFTANVFVELCRAPAFIGTHTPTATSADTDSCCPVPELQPLLDMYPIVFGFEITTPTDIALLEPSPIDVTAEESLTDGWTLGGLPIGLAYVLSSDESVPLFTGVTTASMDFELGCGTYYMSLEPVA